MEQDKRYKQLASKWVNKTITPEEMEEFSAWYNANQDAEISVPEFLASSEGDHKQRILDKINQQLDTQATSSRNFNLIKRFSIAAAILTVLSVGFYFMNKDHTSSIETDVQVSGDIPPGQNKAILTLANGEDILLNDTSSGKLASEAGITIHRNSEGEIQYEAEGALIGNPDRAQFNTIRTPKGGQYQIVLVDGTKIWLNANSKLTYPTYFNKKERRIQLVGEAYFEVAKMHSKGRSIPFIVETNGQEVEVLGTEFNVNAYEDEGDVKTTLVEGSVKVERTGNNQSVVLKPGQQSRVSSANQNIHLLEVEPMDYIAWQSDYFIFNDTDIYTIMRQFSRWYDIEVHYEATTINDLFVGKIPRSATLSEALKVFEAVGVKFKINGRKLFVVS